MAVPSQVFELIESTVEGLGYELVDVERLPRGVLSASLLIKKAALRWTIAKSQQSF